MSAPLWLTIAIVVGLVFVAWLHELHCRIEQLESKQPKPLKPRPAHWTDPLNRKDGI